MVGTLERLPAQAERKVGMTSSRHGPYTWGFTHATMGVNRGVRGREVKRIPKIRPQFGLQAATRLHEAGIASSRRSAILR